MLLYACRDLFPRKPILRKKNSSIACVCTLSESTALVPPSLPSQVTCSIVSPRCSTLLRRQLAHVRSRVWGHQDREQRRAGAGRQSGKHGHDFRSLVAEVLGFRVVASREIGCPLSHSTLRQEALPLCCVPVVSGLAVPCSDATVSCQNKPADQQVSESGGT